MEDEGRSVRMGRPRAEDIAVPTAEKIVMTAARLFLAHGYEGVSTEAVASASGVTKAMVYYYYGTKMNLFASAIEWMMEKSRDRTKAILQRPVSLRENLVTIAITRLRIAAPLEVDAMMQGSRTSLSGEHLLRIRKAEEQMLAVLADAFAAAMARSEIREMDPFLAARVFLAVLMIGKKEQLESPCTEDEMEKRCQLLIDLFWSGVQSDVYKATD